MRLVHSFYAVPRLVPPGPGRIQKAVNCYLQHCRLVPRLVPHGSTWIHNVCDVLSTALSLGSALGAARLKLDVQCV